MEQLSFTTNQDISGEWSAVFTIGVQTFYLKPNGDREHAEWYVEQLKTAFKNLTRTPEPLPIKEGEGVSAEEYLDNKYGDKVKYGNDELLVCNVIKDMEEYAALCNPAPVGGEDTSIEKFIIEHGKDFKNAKSNYEFLSISSLKSFISKYKELWSDESYKTGLCDGYAEAVRDKNEEIELLKEEIRYP